VKDSAALRKSTAKEIRIFDDNKQLGAHVWKSIDGELAAATVGDVLVIGNAEVVTKCLEAKQTGQASVLSRELSSSDAAAVTAANEEISAGIVEAFSPRKDENQHLTVSYKTETRFNRNGIERRTTSDFGFIGSIIGWLMPE